MEVHHSHGHHGPKKVKEYLVEFFMLFLAVSLGFLAENIRESSIERHRSHDLAVALRTDVEADILKMKSVIDSREEILAAAKYTVYDVEQHGFQRSDIKQYRNMLRAAYYWLYFEPRTANLDQIINSGSLRYFRSAELINSISNYKNSILLLETRNEREKQYFNDVMQPLVLKHMNLAPMDTTHFTSGMLSKDFFHKIDSGLITLHTKDLILFDNSPEVKFEVVNAFRSFSINLTNSLRNSNKPYMKEAEHLVELLNKEIEE